MASIRTAIELQDNFTGILMNVINAVNMSISTMEQMQSVMNGPIDTAGIQGMRDQLDQATIAAQELDAAIQGIDTPGSIPATTSIPSPGQPSPVEIPVVWRTDGLDVFTNSGIERFQQEVQSTERMLSSLDQTQAIIAARAARTDLLPPGMAADMDGMRARLQAIQEKIVQIESDPLNLGTDMANTGLEQMRTQLDRAIQEQQDLNSAILEMDVQAANEAYLRLSQTVGSTERYIRDNVDAQGRFNQEVAQGADRADELMQAIKRAVAAYATAQTALKTLDLSDQLISTTARLDMMNDGLQTTQALQDMIFLSAERSRGSYQATADAVSKMGLMAGNAFGDSQEIIAFMEQINKQFVIAGTEASGVQAAMLQLTQAMGSGVLRGEEYNSILEQAPNIIQSIASYIEGNGDLLSGMAAAMDMEVEELAGNVQGNLKDIAGEGLISAELVKNAMFFAAEETNAKFESMPKTFEQIWTSFENHALMAFQPILQRMNEIGNSEAFQGFVNGAIEGLSILAGIALETFDLLIGGAQLIADNWSWLSPIILGVAGALAVYYGWQMAANIISMVGHGIHVAMAIAQMMQAAAAGTLTAATAAGIAAQNGLNAAMYACPIVWIIVLIIALVAAFYAAVAAVNKFAGTSVSATGIIAGVFAVLGAHIANTFIVPTWNGFASLANFFGNVFNDPVAAVKVLFYDMCLTVIGYIQNLASAIETLLNKIPGVTVDITSGLDGFYSQLESAQQAVKDGSGWVEYVQKMDFIDYGDAARAGYSFGKGIDESIAGFDPSSLFESNIPDPRAYADLSNYGAGAGLDGIGSGVDDIAGNTGAMADAMDITSEELKYLRDIAEQEAINRFTTAEITIEQTNHNTVNSGMDLDGIVSGLDDALGEAIEIMTEGVHV